VRRSNRSRSDPLELNNGLLAQVGPDVLDAKVALSDSANNGDGVMGVSGLLTVVDEDSQPEDDVADGSVGQSFEDEHGSLTIGTGMELFTETSEVLLPTPTPTGKAEQMVQTQTSGG
jgi:hypothetical protein